MPKYHAHESAIIDPGASIGSNTQIWHFSHICSGAQIGDNCSFGQSVYVAGEVKIGNNVKVQNNVSIYQGVELEDNVFCGPSMVFTNVRTPRSAFPRNTPSDYQRTLVRNGASIGANATIVCGVTIGRNAFVAAGAVIIADVPDHALMAGVPATRIGWSCECGEVLRPTGTETRYHCPSCERKYQVVLSKDESSEQLQRYAD